MKQTNPFEAAMEQLTLAEKKLEKSAAINKVVTLLRQPKRYVEVSVPVIMDDGSLRIFQGYRVQFNNILGPYKGGIRFHPHVSIDEVKALAFWMSIKCAVAGLPLGGGKGGVIVDPKTLSLGELERLSRGYARAIADVIGPDVDVPAPDVNTNGMIMGWMLDEYRKSVEKKNPKLEKKEREKLQATFTGKKLTDGGSEGREEATGLGGWFALKTVLAKLGKKPQGLTAAIQGFGNVGFFAAKFLTEQGIRVVAVSDSRGGVYVKEGINPELTLACKKEKGTLSGCYCSGSVCDLSKGKLVTNEALLELPVDIVVPAALENVLTAKNASKIQASVVLEMANGPTTPEADKILLKRGIPVIPDVLANGGGVTVSCFEWEQNLLGEHWTHDQVLAKLDANMEKATTHVWEKANKHKVPMRTAAFMIAIEKMAEIGREQ